jgi:hypothetical protein
VYGYKRVWSATLGMLLEGHLRLDRDETSGLMQQGRAAKSLQLLLQGSRWHGALPRTLQALATKKVTAVFLQNQAESAGCAVKHTADAALLVCLFFLSCSWLS